MPKSVSFTSQWANTQRPSVLQSLVFVFVSSSTLKRGLIKWEFNYILFNSISIES